MKMAKKLINLQNICMIMMYIFCNSVETDEDWGWVCTKESIFQIVMYFTQLLPNEGIELRQLYFLCKFFININVPYQFFHSDKMPRKLLRKYCDSYMKVEHIGLRITMEMALNDMLF